MKNTVIAMTQTDVVRTATAFVGGAQAVVRILPPVNALGSRDNSVLGALDIRSTRSGPPARRPPV